MFKYISLSTFLFYSTFSFLSAQNNIVNENPNIDKAKNLNSASYFGDKHSPNKSAYTFKLFSKVMNGKSTKTIFNTHMQQIGFQMSFLNYDYKLVDKKAFFDNIKNRLMTHPNAKEFSEVITLMIEQLENFYISLPDEKEVSLKSIAAGLTLYMEKETTLGSFTGEYFWNFLNSAYNPFEHLKVLIDKEAILLNDKPNNIKSENNFSNYYWDIESLYAECKGKHLNVEFFLTYIQEKMDSSKSEAEKEIYIVVTQEIIRALKNEYYIPEFYLEKMQSALHTYIQKERFGNSINKASNKKDFNSWIQTIEKGFSLAMLPFSLMQDKFSISVKDLNNTPLIRLKGKSKTFIHNSAVRAHTYDIELLNNEITLNNKIYTVELMNYTGVESSINNKRSLLIYPKGKSNTTNFIQLNILLSTEHYKIESFRLLVTLINIDLTKNLESIDKDLYQLTNEIKVSMTN